MPKKIAIVTPMFQRHDIFELYIKGVNALHRDGVEIIPCISGSEGKISERLAKKAINSRYVEVPNMPLSEKVNVALRLGKDCDYFLNLGSDDVIHPDAFTIYLELIEKGFDFIGVTDFYFFDTLTRQALYWGGYREDYRKGCTCGAGRVLSRKFVEDNNWHIWEERDSGRLDTSMQIKINNYDGMSCVFSLKEHRVFGVDIKSEINMTPFERWDNTIVVNSKILTNKFKYLWK
jgi:hypothetical protein